MKSDLAERMRLPCDWGLEIVTLFEALRHRAAGRICQVEIAERYDHKHQALSADDPVARPQPDGPRRGEAPAADTRRGGREPRPAASCMSLLAAYQREAEDAVARQPRGGDRSTASCFDRHAEERNVQVFTAGAARRDRGVPGRPAGPAARAQLGAGLGGHARRGRAAPGRGREGATRRRGGPGDEPGRRSSRPTSTGRLLDADDLRLRAGAAGARRAAAGAACRSCCAAARRGRRWSRSPPRSASPGRSWSRTAAAIVDAGRRRGSCCGAPAARALAARELPARLGRARRASRVRSFARDVGRGGGRR